MTEKKIEFTKTNIQWQANVLEVSTKDFKTEHELINLIWNSAKCINKFYKRNYFISKKKNKCWELGSEDYFFTNN